MDIETAKACTHLSDEEKITFPEVVQRLLQGGWEHYYADLLASVKTYYSQNIAFTVDSTLKFEMQVANAFNTEGVIQAIREIQNGRIQYQSFLKKIMDSGVVSYMVFLTGRKAVYFGRNGEQHIELFPTAK